jgi:hypothetical protein
MALSDAICRCLIASGSSIGEAGTVDGVGMLTLDMDRSLTVYQSRSKKALSPTP